MSDNLKQIGAQGENIARAHIERLGWRVIELNFRCKSGEMDIIAEEPSAGGSTLVFIEVKTRHGAAHGSPVEAVDTRKLERLHNIAAAYLGQRGAGGEEPACRFDIAEVIPDGQGRYSVRMHRAVSGAR